MSPGDLVVCVNNSPLIGAFNGYLHLLTKGDIYTVKETIGGYNDGHCGIRIAEVFLPDHIGWWHSARFRPCRKTNIYALIECAKERQRADVE